jgi:hypothetical protein
VGVIGIGIEKFVFIYLTVVCKTDTKVRTMPSRRRIRANFSRFTAALTPTGMHGADLHILSQPNTSLAEGRGDHVDNERWLRVGVLLPCGP